MQRNRTLMNGVTLHDKIYKASLGGGGGGLEIVGIRRIKKVRKYAKIQKRIVEMET